MCTRRGLQRAAKGRLSRLRVSVVSAVLSRYAYAGNTVVSWRRRAAFSRRRGVPTAPTASWGRHGVPMAPTACPRRDRVVATLAAFSRRRVPTTPTRRQNAASPERPQASGDAASHDATRRCHDAVASPRRRWYRTTPIRTSRRLRPSERCERRFRCPKPSTFLQAARRSADCTLY